MYEIIWDGKPQLSCNTEDEAQAQILYVLEDKVSIETLSCLTLEEGQPIEIEGETYEYRKR